MQQVCTVIHYTCDAHAEDMFCHSDWLVSDRLAAARLQLPIMFMHCCYQLQRSMGHRGSCIKRM